MVGGSDHCNHAPLTATPATSDALEEMRVLRNSVRHCFTRDTRYISPRAQRRWFEQFTGRIYVYSTPEDAMVGYGLVTDGWVSLAVKEEYRKCGYGTAIYRHLANCGGRRAEIRHENVPSLLAALRAGWTRVDDPLSVFIEVVHG